MVLEEYITSTQQSGSANMWDYETAWDAALLIGVAIRIWNIVGGLFIYHWRFANVFTYKGPFFHHDRSVAF